MIVSHEHAYFVRSRPRGLLCGRLVYACHAMSACACGKTIATAVPTPGALSMVNSPPTPSTRAGRAGDCDRSVRRVRNHATCALAVHRTNAVAKKVGPL